MQKKLLLIAGLSLVFVLIIFLLILQTTKKGFQPPPATTPTVPLTTSTLPRQPVQALRVVSTEPPNNRQQVTLNSLIVVNFNRKVNPEELLFEFTNDSFLKVNYGLEFSGNKVILIPQSSLEQSRIYSVRVMDSFKREIYRLKFMTLTVAPSPDTRPVAALTETIIRTRAERPDVYLANLMPYESYDFSMKLEIKPGGYFNFVVTSKRLGKNLLEARVEQWLLGLELTQEQIKGLPLEYR